MSIVLEDIIVTQVIKKVPACYGTEMFIIVFTKACQWTISSAR
jgi:hypothetical protein